MMSGNPKIRNKNSIPFLPEATEWLKGKTLPSEVAVAWSGGADSTALLLAMASQGHRVQAWHIDHAWRTGSAAETEMLKKKAEKWGIPFLSTRDSAVSVRNREGLARDFRYQQFAMWAKIVGVNYLCVAHHHQDQAETICLRMLQGAGVHGICGMAEMRQVNGLQVLRPLLNVSKKDLRQALQNAGVTWIEDSTNHDLSLWRNRIRHRVFPAIAKAGVDPFCLFQRWGAQAKRLAAIIDADMLSVPIEYVQGGVSVAWRDWEKLKPSVRARLLQEMTQKLFGDGVLPGRRHICAVEAWTLRGGSGGLDLSRCRLHRYYGRLHLTPAGEKLAIDRHD